MATVDIDEAELQRLNTLRNTVATLLKNPVAKLKIQEAVRLQFPDAQTPELDAATMQYKSEEAMLKEIRDLKDQVAKDKQDRENEDKLKAFTSRHEQGFEKLRQDGWTDAGVTEVRKIMEEKGITDHAIAAAYYEKLHPPQSPIAANGRGGWDFMAQVTDGDVDLKKLIESKGENASLLDKMAGDALTEVRTNARR